MTEPVAKPFPCKHCGESVTSTGWHHASGPTSGLQSCCEAISGLPYGYRAAPVGAPCGINCLGYVEPPA